MPMSYCFNSVWKELHFCKPRKESVAIGYVNMSQHLLINYIQEITVTHDVVKSKQLCMEYCGNNTYSPRTARY